LVGGGKLNMEEKVENIIYEKVFILFAQNKFADGKKILNKLFLQYNDRIEKLETKRLLIQNLAWVEFQLKDLDNAKIHITMIRELVEQDLEYILLNELHYCKLLNHYTLIFETEMNKDEYKEIQLYNAGVYEKIGAIGRQTLALTNIYLMDKDYNSIVELLKGVHEKIGQDEQEKYCIEEILKELKKYSIVHYKEALNITQIKYIHGKEVTDDV
jgi:hypothetical protein